MFEDTSIYSFKNWATATGFITTINLPNSSTDIVDQLSSSCTWAKIKIKKLQRSDTYIVIYIKNFLLLIINVLFISFYLKYLVKE